MAPYRGQLEQCGLQAWCFFFGLYGLCFGSRKESNPSDIYGSIGIYCCNSRTEEIAALWHKTREAGPICTATFVRSVSRGGLEAEIRDALELTTLLSRKKRVEKRNGDILASIRTHDEIDGIWKRCKARGFTGRPYSNRDRKKGIHSFCPGSTIVMYDSAFDEILVIWERDLVGPVEMATFVRTAGPGTLEREIRSICFPDV